MFKVYKACIDSVSLCLIHRGVNKYTMSWTSNCAKQKQLNNWFYIHDWIFCNQNFNVNEEVVNEIL